MGQSPPRWWWPGFSPPREQRVGDGFEHFKNGVWVVDLSARTFQERMDDLVASLR
jgi:hypothetical protein